MATKTPLLDPETQALLHFGWIRAIDAFFLLALLAAAAVGLAWWTFGTPSPANLLGLLLVSIVVLLVWCVMLLYRACYFILKMRSVIELMPEAAARVAVKFITSGALASQSEPPKQQVG